MVRKYHRRVLVLNLAQEEGDSIEQDESVLEVATDKWIPMRIPHHIQGEGHLKKIWSKKV